MDIRECYLKLGGNYDEILTRMMGKENLVEKFLRRFPADESFSSLKLALSNGDGEAAFRAAHTLKGVAKNLALTRLGDAASSLTEALRGGKIPPEAEELTARVEELYNLVISCVEELG